MVKTVLVENIELVVENAVVHSLSSWHCGKTGRSNKCNCIHASCDSTVQVRSINTTLPFMPIAQCLKSIIGSPVGRSKRALDALVIL